MKWTASHALLLVLSLFLFCEAQALGQATDERGQTDLLNPSAAVQSSAAQSPSESATIRGTVTDIGEQPVGGATVTVLDPESSTIRTATTDGLGFFELQDLTPGITYHVTVSAAGFARWESPAIVLKPGQREVLDVRKLQIEELQTAVTVTPETTEEMAIQQVKVEEKQRGFGIIPNFFAVYDPNPAPLTAKLKFNLAFRVLRDPFTLGGVAMVAGIEQAANHPAYVQGLKGYGERYGSTYANQFSSIMIGGAILPAILHQDPRYFYQGGGTKKSRALHALSNLFVTKTDSGRLVPNISSLGGDLASASIANLYYPEQNEQAKAVLESFAVNTAIHAAVRLLQEFAFRPAKGTVVGSAGDLTPSH